MESQVSHGEGQGEAAEEVCQGEVKKPNRVYCVPHLQASHPQHQPVAWQSQYESEAKNGCGKNCLG